MQVVTEYEVQKLEQWCAVSIMQLDESHQISLSHTFHTPVSLGTPCSHKTLALFQTCNSLITNDALSAKEYRRL